MIALEITDEDCIAPDAELAERISRVRAERESVRDRFMPTPSAELRREIAQREKAVSTYHFECVCGCPIVTRVQIGVCPSCARHFDLRR